MELLIFLQFLVAMCMSLAAVFFFIWGVLAGQTKDIESIKYRMLERELGTDAGGRRE
jgi:cbb3-type cytochrome oxidase maturation protein